MSVFHLHLHHHHLVPFYPFATAHSLMSTSTPLCAQTTLIGRLQRSRSGCESRQISPFLTRPLPTAPKTRSRPTLTMLFTPSPQPRFSWQRRMEVPLSFNPCTTISHQPFPTPSVLLHHLLMCTVVVAFLPFPPQLRLSPCL
jgi:hypothetical protein